MYKALFADDEPYIIEGLNILADWESMGIEVIGAAEDGEDAYSIIMDKKPDIVIADINMPNMDGLELLKKCRSQMKNPPEFLMLTGFSELSYIKKAMKYGAAGYLLKPINREELNEHIELVLANIAKKNELESETDELIDYIAHDLFMRLLFDECDQKLINRIRFFLGMDAVEEYVSLTLFAVKENAGAEGTERVLEKIRSVPSVNRIGVFDAGFSFAAWIAPRKSEAELTSVAQELMTEQTVESIIIMSPQKPEKLSAVMANLVRDRQQGFFTEKLYNYYNKWSVTESTDEDSGDISEVLNQIREGKLKDAEGLVEKKFFGMLQRKLPLRRIRGFAASVMVELYKYIQRIGMDCSEDFNVYSYRISKAVYSGEICEICKNILHRMDERTKKEKSISDFTNALDYIEKNYKNNITLLEIGKAIYVKPAVVSKIVKNATGMKFSDYLNSLRMKEACRLISKTDMTIAGIAAEVGYGDYAYFANKFKMSTGCLPSEYRKRVRQSK
ncbi:MAG: response regulator [Candidatus Ornithomonoglobus sp.]